MDNISEFVLDKDSAARIEKIIHMYPISLRQCADLLTGCIPLLEVMSGGDVVRIMTYCASIAKGGVNPNANRAAEHGLAKR